MVAVGIRDRQEHVSMLVLKSSVYRCFLRWQHELQTAIAKTRRLVALQKDVDSSFTYTELEPSDDEEATGKRVSDVDFFVADFGDQPLQLSYELILVEDVFHLGSTSYPAT